MTYKTRSEGDLGKKTKSLMPKDRLSMKNFLGKVMASRKKYEKKP
jgi:hypothetical protein